MTDQYYYSKTQINLNKYLDLNKDSIKIHFLALVNSNEVRLLNKRVPNQHPAAGLPQLAASRYYTHLDN